MARRLARWGTWIGRPWIVLTMACEQRRYNVYTMTEGDGPTVEIVSRSTWKARPHEVIIARCSAPGRMVPWWAIARVMRHRLGDERQRGPVRRRGLLLN